MRNRLDSWRQKGWQPLPLIEFTAPRDWKTTASITLDADSQPLRKIALAAGTRLRYEERSVQEFYDQYRTITRRFVILDGEFRSTRVSHIDEYWWGDYSSGSLVIQYVPTSFPPDGLRPEIGEWRPWGLEHE